MKIFFEIYTISKNNNDSKGIAIIIDYNKLPSATSIDGTIIFKKFNNRTKKLDGEIYLYSNGEFPISYKLEGHFSDVLSYNKVQLQ